MKLHFFAVVCFCLSVICAVFWSISGGAAVGSGFLAVVFGIATIYFMILACLAICSR